MQRVVIEIYKSLFNYNSNNFSFTLNIDHKSSSMFLKVIKHSWKLVLLSSVTYGTDAKGLERISGFRDNRIISSFYKMWRVFWGKGLLKKWLPRSGFWGSSFRESDIREKLWCLLYSLQLICECSFQSWIFLKHEAWSVFTGLWTYCIRFWQSTFLIITRPYRFCRYPVSSDASLRKYLDQELNQVSETWPYLL